MNKIKNFLNKFNNKESMSALAAAATATAFGVATQAHATASKVVSNLLGYVFGIFFWIGVVLIAWGIGQLVLAFKNEDGDSKSRAIMLIIASIVLMSISAIFNGLGLGVSANLNTSF